MKKYIIKAFGLMAIISFISCTSTTTIRALKTSGDVDRDVKIYLDGGYVGKGEVTHSDTKIVGATTDITLKKQGCRSSNRHFSRSERLSVGALVGGIFFLIPFLWVMEYNPVHSYEFECDK